MTASTPTSSGTVITSQPLVNARQALGELKQEASTFAHAADRYFDMALAFAPRLLGALIILILAWMISSWARKRIYTAFNRPGFDQTLVRFFSTASKWIILVVAIVACLAILGIETTSVLTVMGAAGLAIGLAIQGSLSNLASGIMLLILRPFKVGDVVTIAGQLGKIDEIELFHTKLDTFDNRRLILPNGQVFGSVIENITHHAQRRIDLTIGVEYAADIDRTRDALNRAISSVDGRLTVPEPEVALTGLGPSSVDWQVRVWTRTSDFGVVRQRLIRACKVALGDAGIGIPFPQTEVWLRQAPQMTDADGDGRSEPRARLDTPNAVPPSDTPDPE